MIGACRSRKSDGVWSLRVAEHLATQNFVPLRLIFLPAAPKPDQGFRIGAETDELFGGPVEATALHVRGGHEGCGRVGVVDASVGKRGKVAQLALLRLIQLRRKEFVRGDSLSGLR